VKDCCLILRGSVAIGPAFSLDGQTLDLAGWLPEPSNTDGSYGVTYGSSYGGTLGASTQATDIEFDDAPFNSRSKRRLRGIGNAELELNWVTQDLKFIQDFQKAARCPSFTMRDVVVTLTFDCASCENLEMVFGQGITAATFSVFSEIAWVGTTKLNAGQELHTTSPVKSLTSVITTTYKLNGADYVADVTTVLTENIDYIAATYGIKLLRGLPAATRDIVIQYESVMNNMQVARRDSKRYALVFNGQNIVGNNKLGVSIPRIEFTPVSNFRFTDDTFKRFQIIGNVRSVIDHQNGARVYFNMLLDDCLNNDGVVVETPPPPPPPPTPVARIGMSPIDQFTQLALRGDSFIDLSGKSTLTFPTLFNAELPSINSVLGGIEFQNGQRIFADNPIGWNLPQEFTISFDSYIILEGTFNQVLGIWGSVQGNLWQSGNGGTNTGYFLGAGSVDYTQAPSNLENEWHKYTFTRDSVGTLRQFKDGILYTTRLNYGTVQASSAASLGVGGLNAQTIENPHKLHRNIELSFGICRYTVSFNTTTGLPI
jgi:hypothetical protein